MFFSLKRMTTHQAVGRAITITTTQRTLNLVAATEEQRKEWVLWLQVGGPLQPKCTAFRR